MSQKGLHEGLARRPGADTLSGAACHTLKAVHPQRTGAAASDTSLEPNRAARAPALQAGVVRAGGPAGGAAPR